MDLLRDNEKSLFFKYFRATILSSMIMTIYTLVDTICIGQYEGADGSAAVACVIPLWTIIFALGLLFGVGGSVLMAQHRGTGEFDEGNKYFNVGLIISIILSAILLVIYVFAGKQLLIFSGADSSILDKSLDYLKWISLAVPSFLIGQYLMLFIRNDGAPMWTTVATICGGAFNIFGDIYFVFGLDMGISGAGLATALGQVIFLVVLVAYFFTKTCKLKISFKELGFFKKLKRIVVMGISNFVVDIAMGVVALIFNNQIMKYLGAAALGVYGVVSNLATVVQTFGYAVGEAAQAIISVNFGAGKADRIRKTVKYSAITSAVIGVCSFALIELFPLPIVKFYMSATPEVLMIAPAIMRSYFVAMIFLVFNVFSTYYFQSIGRPIISTTVSLMRGIVVSGALLIILPLIFGGNAIWLSAPIAEAVVFIFVIVAIKKSFNKIY